MNAAIGIRACGIGGRDAERVSESIEKGRRSRNAKREGAEQGLHDKQIGCDERNACASAISPE